MFCCRVYGVEKGAEMKENFDLPIIDYKTFNAKSEQVKRVIREALFIMQSLGLPIDEYTDRKKEKAAMALLAVANVKKSTEWKKMKCANDDYSVTTKEIIEFDNTYLEDNISPGSYDYVLRDDLKQLLIAEVVIKSKPGANISNPTRGYKISVEYAKLIRNYGQPDWLKQVESFNKMHPSYKDRLNPTRDIPKIPVTTADGSVFMLKEGEHNIIQKLVIEEFLSRFGNSATLLYLGDSDNKFQVCFEKEKLKDLGFLDITQGKLPDIVAYSESKDWIYMIEAYHTSNPITPERKLELKKVMGASASKGVFVTAFENITSYRTCSEELAWETEIWIATEPDHMIHRNGSRFLGPYPSESN